MRTLNKHAFCYLLKSAEQCSNFVEVHCMMRIFKGLHQVYTKYLLKVIEIIFARNTYVQSIIFRFTESYQHPSKDGINFKKYFIQFVIKNFKLDSTISVQKIKMLEKIASSEKSYKLVFTEI